MPVLDKTEPDPCAVPAGPHPRPRGARKELLFELSAKLISLSLETIGQEIENGLKLIGEFWNFDRITLTEFLQSSREIKITHSYIAPGVSRALLKKTDEDISWIIERLQRDQAVLLSRLPDDLPDEAKFDQRYCIREGLKSALALPFTVGPSILGGCFLPPCIKGACGERRWSRIFTASVKFWPAPWNGRGRPDGSMSS